MWLFLLGGFPWSDKSWPWAATSMWTSHTHPGVYPGQSAPFQPAAEAKPWKIAWEIPGNGIHNIWSFQCLRFSLMVKFNCKKKWEMHSIGVTRRKWICWTDKKSFQNGRIIFIAYYIFVCVLSFSQRGFLNYGLFQLPFNSRGHCAQWIVSQENHQWRKGWRGGNCSWVHLCNVRS